MNIPGDIGDTCYIKGTIKVIRAEKDADGINNIQYMIYIDEPHKETIWVSPENIIFQTGEEGSIIL